jgi:phosphoglycerate dehydrogenase-like enzyme
VRVLVSAVVLEQFGEQVRSVAPPDTQWLVLQGDGTVSSVGAEAVSGGLPGDLSGVLSGGLSGEVSGASLRSGLGDVDVAFWSNDVFYGPNAAFMALVQGATSVRFLQSGAAGTEAPLYRQVIGQGGRVARSHVTAVPLAEHVVWAVLDHYRQPAQWAAARAAREWKSRVLREVAGTTWLVVGLGAIGREVAGRGQAMGARVVGVRRSPDGTEPVDVMIRPADLLHHLAGADVVVIAADANTGTRHLVDAEFLAQMRRGSILVNVARGSMVDEPALRAALDRGVPELAVLDVFATEPLPRDSEWWDHPRVVLTPHAAGSGEGRLARAVEVFVENLERFAHGEPLVHELTVDQLPDPVGADGWHSAR